MPIAFACQSCQKQYKVDDKFAGKKVKCKACGNAMLVPASAGAKPSAKQAAKAAASGNRAKGKAPNPNAKKQAAAKKPVAKAAPVTAVASKEYGLDAISSTDDLFGGETPVRGKANPLGNHVVADPGFAAIDISATKKEDADTPQFSANPALSDVPIPSQFNDESKTNAKPKSEGGLLKPALFSAIGVVLVFAIFLGVGFAVAIAGIIGAVILMVAGFGIGIWSEVWSWILCKRNHPELLIWFILFPISRLIYLFKNFSFMKGPFLLNLVGVFAMMLGIGLLVAMGVIHGESAAVLN